MIAVASRDFEHDVSCRAGDHHLVGRLLREDKPDTGAIGHGLFTSGPAACCSSDGQRLYVFGTGTDNNVWWALSTNGGQTWHVAWSQIHPAAVDSAPAAVCSDDGKVVRVFARSTGGQIPLWCLTDRPKAVGGATLNRAVSYPDNGPASPAPLW